MIGNDDKKTSDGSACDSSPQSAANINSSAWLLNLYFRPGLFFAGNARSASKWIVAFCSFVLGASFGLLHYISVQDLSSIPSGQAAIYVSLATVLYGVVGGAAAYFLLGSLYGFLISLCKPCVMDWNLARRTFVFSGFVYALPLAAGTAAWWVRPNIQLFTITLLVTEFLMLWSAYVGYRGVRVLFNAEGSRSSVLILAFPAILFMLLWMTPTPLKNAKVFLSHQTTAYENECFKAQLPIGWKNLASSQPSLVQFSNSKERSFFALVKKPTSRPAPMAAVSRMTVKKMEANCHASARELGTFSTLGERNGAGLRVAIDIEGKPKILRVFSDLLPDKRILIITELCDEKDEFSSNWQFEILRKSLTVKPALNQDSQPAGHEEGME